MKVWSALRSLPRAAPPLPPSLSSSSSSLIHCRAQVRLCSGGDKAAGGRAGDSKGAMNAFMKNVKPTKNSKSWQKSEPAKHRPHSQYFAVDDPNAKKASAKEEGEEEEQAGMYSPNDGNMFEDKKMRRGGRRRGQDGDDGDAADDKAFAKQMQNRDDDNRDPREGMSETVLKMIDDWSYFEELGREGLTVDTSEMDDLDAFMSIIYAEGAKTSDGTVWGTMEEGVNEKGKGGKRNKVRIPHPRTTRQLVRTTVPQICPKAGGAPGSEGVALAIEAWKVLAKNPYYTLQEKKDMCNRIARKANWYLDDSQGLYDEDVEESKQTANKRKWSKQDIEKELVWKENWSRGLKGIEEEEALAQKLEEEALMNRNKDYIGQDDTNWDVQAVVDEDDLFK